MVSMEAYIAEGQRAERLEAELREARDRLSSYKESLRRERALLDQAAVDFAAMRERLDRFMQVDCACGHKRSVHTSFRGSGVDSSEPCDVCGCGWFIEFDHPLCSAEAKLAELVAWRRGLTRRWYSREVPTYIQHYVHGLAPQTVHRPDEACPVIYPDGSTECDWLAANAPVEG